MWAFRILNFADQSLDSEVAFAASMVSINLNRIQYLSEQTNSRHPLWKGEWEGEEVRRVL